MKYTVLSLRVEIQSSQSDCFSECDFLKKRVSKLVGILRSAQFRHVLQKQHVAAGVEHVAVLHNLGDIRLVADIGANRGQFALAARHCFPGALIFSFEPLSGPAEIFRKVFAADERIRLHVAAIGRNAGSTMIYVSARDDSSSLLPIADLQNKVFPGTGGVTTGTIQVAPLSQFLAPQDIETPALLKLDVQGYELEALKGCEDLLDRFAYVYVECSFMELYKGQALTDEVIAWLRKHSFQLCGCYNMYYDRRGQAVQADFLFRRVAPPNCVPWI